MMLVAGCSARRTWHEIAASKGVDRANRIGDEAYLEYLEEYLLGGEKNSRIIPSVYSTTARVVANNSNILLRQQGIGNKVLCAGGEDVLIGRRQARL